MRIWLLNHYACPAHVAGGTRHAALTKYLRQRGHQVTVFASAEFLPAGSSGLEGAAERFGEGNLFRPACNSGHSAAGDAGPPALAAPPLFTDRVYEDVHWRFVRTTAHQTTSERFFNMRSFKQNVLSATDGLERPDLVIGSCVHPYAVDAALRLARRHGVPFVYEIRDIWPETLVDVGAISPRHPVYWLFRHIARRAFRRAAGVIVVCPGMTQYAQRHGLPADRICFLPNGVDPALCVGVEEPPPPDRFVFSYLGTLGRVYGLDTLIEAAALLQHRHQQQHIAVRLVGDGTEKSALQELAAARSLNNVEFLDWVAKPELPRVAQASHGFIYCQRPMRVIERYGLSANKLFDYLSNARPTVFACRSFNNPIEEAGAGLTVSPRSPEELAQAMMQLSRLPEEHRRQMGLNGRSYVLQHHNLELLSQRLEDFLLRVAALRAPQRKAA